MRDMWKELLFALNPWAGDTRPAKKEGGSKTGSKEGSQALLTSENGLKSAENIYGEINGHSGGGGAASAAKSKGDDGGYAIFNDLASGRVATNGGGEPPPPTSPSILEARI